MVSEVYPGVFRISFPMPDPLENVHSYLIEGDEDHVLVDTGWSDFEALLYGVKETGIDPGSITQLVLTHSHPDHTGSVEEVRKHTQAKVFMHPYESLYFGAMKSVETEMRDWFEINGVPKGSIEGLISAFGVPEPPEVDAKIEPEHVFSVGNLRWRAIWTPGHSPGHINLYEPDHGILITGDHVLPHETSNVSLGPISPSNPLGDFMDSFKEVKDLETELVLPSHGDSFEDISGRIQELTEHHEQRLEEIKTAFEGGGEGKTAWEAASYVSWSAGAFGDLGVRDKRLAFLETLAHLEYLRDEGLSKSFEDGVTRYHLDKTA